MIFVIDGHDGTGKTTLARRLAERIGADYVAPFSGVDGMSMLDAAESGRPIEADRLAREMLSRQVRDSGAAIKVFDRHWMTVFTLIPQSLWQSWLPLPPTVLCWAELPTICARLEGRAECRRSTEWHAAYLKKYTDLARRFGIPIVRTDQCTEVETLQWLHEWASQF